MSRFRRPYGLTIWPMLLALAWTVGCARPAGLQSDDAAAHADPHSVPFHEGATAAAHPADTEAPPSNTLNPETGLPFQDSQNLPAGTLLTVRLKNQITAENPDANLAFEAVVDEPVVIEGNTLVPRGVTVSGRVESTRASNLKRDRGSVRLTLDSIHRAGATLPIQTSSLFVRGNASDAHLSTSEGPQSDDSTVVIRIEKGRRLTFRLSEPVYVAATQPARADR
jgi:hypothetical protein